jgi:hypothetical protein
MLTGPDRAVCGLINCACHLPGSFACRPDCRPCLSGISFAVPAWSANWPVLGSCQPHPSNLPPHSWGREALTVTAATAISCSFRTSEAGCISPPPLAYHCNAAECFAPARFPLCAVPGVPLFQSTGNSFGKSPVKIDHFLF